ncbi:MAG: hypothetical protein RMK32_08040 [Anaerolineae bacterium]|nr:hypothetical protein [Thermoflexus sp.]MDW8065567.1 hypothetical protein [Anaerolineae bacterium]
MEELSACLLLAKSALLDILKEIRKVLLHLMERPASRRNGIWLGIYTAIAALADSDEGQDKSAVLEILRYPHVH